MGNPNIHKRKRLLSSVEDSKEYSAILQDIASAAGEEAVLEAKILKIPITYLNASRQVVKEFPDGRIEILEQRHFVFGFEGVERLEIVVDDLRRDFHLHMAKALGSVECAHPKVSRLEQWSVRYTTFF